MEVAEAQVVLGKEVCVEAKPEMVASALICQVCLVPRHSVRMDGLGVGAVVILIKMVVFHLTVWVEEEVVVAVDMTLPAVHCNVLLECQGQEEVEEVVA
jgi:hypothetical protein